MQQYPRLLNGFTDLALNMPFHGLVKHECMDLRVQMCMLLHRFYTWKPCLQRHDVSRGGSLSSPLAGGSRIACQPLREQHHAEAVQSYAIALVLDALYVSL